MNHWNRRQFLGAGAASLALAGRGRAAPTAEGMAVLHTTDLHGHILPTVSYDGEKDVGGLARCATQIRQWRKESPENLLLDIGDVYQGTLVSWQTRGKLMIDLYNKLGYDAWVLGNHEFDWGPEVVEEAIERSEMPVLSANLALDGKLVGAERTEGLFQKLRPWIIKELAGEKVGIVGLTTPGLPYWLRQELLGPISVVNPAPVLKRCVAELRSEGATRIIVAGHMGFRERGDDYANPIGESIKDSGVDLYLGGHSHRRAESWTREGVVCTQANYHGLDCGRVTFPDGKPRPELKTMDRKVALDATVMAAAEPFLEAARSEKKRVAGKIPIAITKKDDLRNFLCEAFLAAATQAGKEVDGVFHGTFGGEIKKGPFTVDDAWKVVPYENKLVLAELTSAELVAILQEDAEDRYSDRELFGLLVVKDDSGKVVGVECTPRRERYRVLFNSYDAQSGGRRLNVLRDVLTKPITKSRLLPMDTREAVLNYVSNL